MSRSSSSSPSSPKRSHAPTRSRSSCRPSSKGAPSARGARLPRLPSGIVERGARAPGERPGAGEFAPDARARRAGAGARARRSEQSARRTPCCERRAHRPARCRGKRPRRARPRRRQPGRRRDQEGSGHRAAHREEPDQGLLRGAGGRATAWRSRRAGGKTRLRPRPATRRACCRAARRHLRARASLCSIGFALRPPRGIAPGSPAAIPRDP